MMESDRGSSAWMLKLKVFSGSDPNQWVDWKNHFEALLEMTDPALKDVLGTERPAPEEEVVRPPRDGGGPAVIAAAPVLPREGGAGRGAGAGARGPGEEKEVEEEEEEEAGAEEAPGGDDAGGEEDPPAVAVADPRVEWDRKSGKVYARLVMFTEGLAANVVEEHIETRNGVAAWQGLIDKFELKGTFGKAILNTNIVKAVFPPTADPLTYFNEIERNARQLRTIGHPVPDDSLLGAALAAIPSTYRTLIDILDTMPDLTYTQFKGLVRGHHQRMTYEGVAKAKEVDAAKALLSSTIGGGGEKKEPAHVLACYGCGSTKHLLRDCPMNKQGQEDQKKKNKQQKSNNKPPRKKFFPKKGKGKESSAPESKNESDGSGKSGQNVALSAFEEFDQSTSPSGQSGGKTIEFVVDSGATSHMVSSADFMEETVSYCGSVYVAGGRVLTSTGMGNIKIFAMNEKSERVAITLHDVLIVPELGPNLLSVPKMLSKKAHVVFAEENSSIQVAGYVFPIEGNKGLYKWNVEAMSTRGQDATEKAVAFTAAVMKAKQWHCRFGHADLRNFSKVDKAIGAEVPDDLSGDPDCKTCSLAKHTSISFPSETERPATTPFENLHADLVGPMEEPSFGGARFLSILTDEFSRWVVVKPIKAKSDFLSSFKDVVGEIRGLGFKIQGLRTDRGGEYVSKDLQDFCRENEINHTYAGPYAPQQMGIAERMNRRIMDMARAMIIHAGMERAFWAEAANTAAYLINRIPGVDGQAPYFRVFRRPCRIRHLRTFGCEAYVQIPPKLRTKLDPKAWRGVFLGYDQSNWRCYRIWDPVNRKVRFAIHVSFRDHIFPLLNTDQAAEDQVIVLTEGSEERVVEPAVAEGRGEPEGIAQQEALPDQGGPEEVRPEPLPLLPRHLNLLDQPHMPIVDIEEAHLASEQYIFSAVEEIMDDPKSFREAVTGPYKEEWCQAMRREIDALKQTKTWILMPISKVKTRLIGSRWVFRTKRNAQGEIVEFKARFVVKGFSQKPGIDYGDTFAPVAKFSSIRTVISLAAREDWELVNLDVNSAFLNSYVNEEIYVTQPEGFEEFGPKGETLACKMQRSLYGLKQAPRNWNAVINAWMTSYGFSISEADPCVYIYRQEADVLIVLLWVDDLIVAGSHLESVNRFKKAIADRFRMKDLGELTWVLGMEVSRDRAKRTIEVTQKAYVELMLKRFNMADCKPVGTPAEGYLQRDIDSVPSRDYMCLVGSLLYAAMVTRPDITYAVQALGRHLQSSNEEHFAAGKRILRYLKGTKELGLRYGVSGSNALIGYADADWASDKDTRRSTTAYVFVLGGAAVSWASKLQPTVALSSSEAEYMSACSAVQEAIHLKRLMKSLGYDQDGPTVIFEDNQGAIKISENPTLHKRSKHIDIKFHFVREKVGTGEVKLVYIETEKQLADILTKPLLKPRVVRLRSKVLGY